MRFTIRVDSSEAAALIRDTVRDPQASVHASFTHAAKHPIVTVEAPEALKGYIERLAERINTQLERK